MAHYPECPKHDIQPLPSGKVIEDGIPYDETQTTSTLTSSCNLLNVFVAVFPVLIFGLPIHRSFGAGLDQPVGVG
jgi:hypothetical protein